jgi:two-component system sensor histidine kinase RegB
MADRHHGDLAWLIRLRFAAIAGQALTIGVAVGGFGFPLPLPALGAILALELVVNVLCAAWARRGRPVSEPLIAAFLAFDVLCLTALLHLSGGSFNPFTVLYLVNIALAAVVLPAVWTWSLVGLSVAGFATLFLGGASVEQHAQQMQMHLDGMWVAFAVAAALIVYFTSRVSQSRDALRTELAAAREQAQRTAHLASLATLAAGAAHELSTPLSTIAIAAKELDRGLAAPQPDLTSAAEDARLIREQVARCRAILDQMAADAGTASGDATGVVPVRDLVAASLEGLADAARVRLELDGDANARVPFRPVARALRALVKNALDASDAAVVVRSAIDGPRVELSVEDSGPGMSAEVLARASEPFFTTKPPGRGMGLGLFVTRNVVEQLGGRLVLESMPGRGTRARLSVPR